MIFILLLYCFVHQNFKRIISPSIKENPFSERVMRVTMLFYYDCRLPTNKCLEDWHQVYMVLAKISMNRIDNDCYYFLVRNEKKKKYIKFHLLYSK